MAYYYYASLCILSLTTISFYVNGWEELDKACHCGAAILNDANNLAFPWVVNVTSKSSDKLSCLGTVIASNLVLVSRKCIKRKYMDAQVTDILVGGDMGVADHEDDGATGVKLHKRGRCPKLVGLQVESDFDGYDYTSIDIKFKPVCLPPKDELNGPGVLEGKQVRYQTSSGRIDGLIVKTNKQCDPKGMAKLVHQGLRNDDYCVTITDPSFDVEAGQPLFMEVLKNPFTDLEGGGLFGYYFYMVGVSAHIWEDGGDRHVFFVSVHDVLEEIEFYVKEANSALCSLPYLWTKKDMATIQRDESLNCECGKLRSGFQGRVFGGQEATKYEFPWIVKLIVTVEGADGSQTCGGSIINNKMILTAAHCVAFADVSSPVKGQTEVTYADIVISVYLNSHAYAETAGVPPSPEKKIIAKQKNVRYHPGFVDGRRRKNPVVEMDIAVIILEEPLDFERKDGKGQPFHRPICFPKYGDKFQVEGQKAIVAGWGNIGKDNTPDKIKFAEFLQKTTVTILPLNKCAEKFRNGTIDSKGEERWYSFRTVICGGVEWDTNAGGGDSGGPEIMERTPKKYWQIGLTSYDYEMLDDNKNVVSKAFFYADLQDINHLSFIEYYSQMYGAQYCKN